MVNLNLVLQEIFSRSGIEVMNDNAKYRFLYYYIQKTLNQCEVRYIDNNFVKMHLFMSFRALISCVTVK